MALKFDLSSLPSTLKVSKAVLSIYASAEYVSATTLKNGPKALYRYTEDWKPDEINWANAPRYSETAVATNSNNSVKVWEDYDVTAEIKKIIGDEADNFGFALVMDGLPTGVVYHSSESGTIAERPKLVITCEDNEAPTVSIINPSKGEKFKLGASCKIAWDVSDLIGVVSRSIYFNSGDGTWQMVDSAAVTSGMGLFSWALPDVVSDKCDIRINAYDAAGNVGTKESGAFSIVDPSGIIPKMSDKFSYTHAKVTITNVQGKVVDSFELTDVKQLDRIKSSSLYSGIHFITISNAREQITEKMLFVK